ncbi:MAG: tol-pal system protein YbgF [Gammaproteobacteria bacterium]|nr:tol-pal system protein YbgF [Gammaproteobacteria bacterium]
MNSSTKRAAAVVVVATLLPLHGALAQRSAPQQPVDPELTQRLARLERVVEGQGLVELLQQVEALQFQVQQLQGRIESQNFALEQLRKQQREVYSHFDGRLRGLETGAAGSADTAAEPPLATILPNDAPVAAGMPAEGAFNVTTAAPAREPEFLDDPFAAPQRPAPATVGGALVPIATTPQASNPPAAQAGVPAARIATVDTPESEKAYNDAFGLLKAGQYDQAIAALRLFLAQHPASQYVDNAQYWLGEAFYTLRKFDTAIAEYQKLLQLYPDSQKYSHALLKIGYSYDELGQRDLARATLQQLKDHYPSSTAAQLADERLARIRAETMR